MSALCTVEILNNVKSVNSPVSGLDAKNRRKAVRKMLCVNSSNAISFLLNSREERTGGLTVSIKEKYEIALDEVTRPLSPRFRTSKNRVTSRNRRVDGLDIARVI